ncbi:MAG: tRNA 2-selenouridine(34) synthase MnmH [Planctomycetes bacterium]|nr:tRNA 2-selenouridine(34) synthase MnmH [Planctomycetota bacterium]
MQDHDTPPMLAGLPAVDPELLLAAPEATIVDLRTPTEFADDHLPGAHNVPLFSNEERALIGTLYKCSSPDDAFDEGRRIVHERIVDLVASIAELTGRGFDPQGFPELVDRITERGIEGLSRELQPLRLESLPRGALVVHCWRGGLRSASVAAFLCALGWEDVHMLYGGYKSYRADVMQQLAAWDAPPAFVLRGLTGTGKTLVLRELERIRPRWTLDLEGAAGHRSSILGMVGLQPVSQKRFESVLAERLRQGFVGRVVFEGESRKVGDAVIPSGVWSALDRGVNLEITAPVARRVQVLCEDYLARDASREQLARQLPYIEKRLGSHKYDGVLVDLLMTGREEELVELLLEKYYDPLYAHSEKERSYVASFDSSDVEACASEIADWIELR